jgi:D-glycero-alpha-D-manno-heptose 1-phosphate guanylyltransferase
VEAIILAGGLGTRLRSMCPDLPKPLAPIAGIPFLSHLMSYWKKEGVSHFILSVGYLHEKIVSTYGSSFEGIPIDYAIESSPLGTGGALLYALSHVSSDVVLVLNGDTLFEVPLSGLLLTGDCTMALWQAKENSRYDGVVLTDTNQVIKIGDPTSTLINGGCYLFRTKGLAPFQKTILSLEKDLLPTVSLQGQCFAQLFDAPFIDIGIPKDYLYYNAFKNSLKRGSSFT